VGRPRRNRDFVNCPIDALLHGKQEAWTSRDKESKEGVRDPAEDNGRGVSPKGLTNGFEDIRV
jgi:hypothetical protein